MKYSHTDWVVQEKSGHTIMQVKVVQPPNVCSNSLVRLTPVVTCLPVYGETFGFEATRARAW